jgi:hypothetical protein
MVRQLHHCGITIVGSRSGSGACAMPQPYLPAAVSRHLPVLYVVCCMLYALSRPVHVACCAAVARSMEREVRASRSHSIQLAHSSTTSRRALGSCRPYAVHCGYTATVLRTARHRTAPHRTALHGMARHGTALHCTARHGTARHSIARHINAASEGTARSRSLRCSLPCCSL